MDKWKAALDGSTHTAEIEADKKAGNDDGISGTPAFIIVAERREAGLLHQRRAELRASSASSSSARSPKRSDDARPVRRARPSLVGSNGERRSGRRFRPRLFECVRAMSCSRASMLRVLAVSAGSPLCSVACAGVARRASRAARVRPRRGADGAAPSRGAERSAAGGAGGRRGGADRRRATRRGGAARRSVTIVEFADFQCPFCARARPTLSRAPRDVRPGQRSASSGRTARSPFHPNARARRRGGARACSRSAGDDAFWRFHDAAFADQGDARARRATSSGRRQAGVTDVDGVPRRPRRPPVGRGGRRRPARGHGSSASSGRRRSSSTASASSGAQPFETFQKLVDEQLAKAQAKVAARHAARARLRRARRARTAPRSRGRRTRTTTSRRHDDGVQGPRRRRARCAGAPTALVTIVEFADFQCPFCVRAEATLEALRDEVRRQAARRLQERAAAVPPARRAGRRGGARGARGEGRRGVLDDARRALRRRSATSATTTLAQLARELGARPDAVKAAIAKHTHATRQHRRRRRPGRRLRGERHAALLHQRSAPRRGAAEGEVRGDHRRGDREGAGARRRRHARPAALYDALTKDGKGPPEPEKRTLSARSRRRDPARGQPRGAKVTMHEWSRLPVPVLRARRADAATQVVKDYGDADEVRVARSAAPDAPGRAARGAGGARGAVQQKGDARVLGDARPAVRRPAAS